MTTFHLPTTCMATAYTLTTLRSRVPIQCGCSWLSPSRGSSPNTTVQHGSSPPACSIPRAAQMQGAHSSRDRVTSAPSQGVKLPRRLHHCRSDQKHRDDSGHGCTVCKAMAKQAKDGKNATIPHLAEKLTPLEIKRLPNQFQWALLQTLATVCQSQKAGWDTMFETLHKYPHLLLPQATCPSPLSKKRKIHEVNHATDKPFIEHPIVSRTPPR